MANYEILVKAVLDRANLQSQLNQIGGTRPATVRANIQLDPDQINRQVQLWENALTKMKSRSPDAFNKVAVQEQVNTFNQLVTSYKSGSIPIKDVTVGLDNVRTSLAQVSGEMRQTTKDGAGFLSTVELNTKKVLQWAIATTALYGTMKEMGKAVDYIKDLDKELTNISVVTGQSSSEVGALARGYNELATELSSTTMEITKGSLAFIRQGKSAEETATLIRNSTIMSKLANLSAAESSEYLTSVMNGFKMTAEETTAAVDAMVAVDNAAATSVKELAEALQRTSSTAQMSGVGFNDLVAYIGTVSSVTRKSAESIGESFNVGGIWA